MKKNVGSYDAGARFVAGCLLLIVALRSHGWIAWFGLVALACAFSGRCPLWWLLRIDTTACDEPRSTTGRQQPEVSTSAAASEGERPSDPAARNFPP